MLRWSEVHPGDMINRILTYSVALQFGEIYIFSICYKVFAPVSIGTIYMLCSDIFAPVSDHNLSDDSMFIFERSDN